MRLILFKAGYHLHLATTMSHLHGVVPAYFSESMLGIRSFTELIFTRRLLTNSTGAWPVKRYVCVYFHLTDDWYFDTSQGTCRCTLLSKTYLRIQQPNDLFLTLTNSTYFSTSVICRHTLRFFYLNHPQADAYLNAQNIRIKLCNVIITYISQ